MASSNKATATRSRDVALLMAPHKAASLGRHQCGDKSHDSYRHMPELESKIRHNCDLPRIPTSSKDEKDRVVITMVHRVVVTKAEVEKYHKKCEARWVKGGGKMVKPQEKKQEDKALVDRKELEADDWEVLDELDVDDQQDIVAEFSGKKVCVLSDGIQ
ncbi:hypothetical protein PRZ48_002141 [Zasmidium cellare]|uniref:Uncharacterized protein n=1 Tax=Zasmidium cellare TaxID=395010 RepID=A0ABR0F5Y8_ZASCE|nr:hypothetical protein PRZ48_002141 [Zasmidium cellare]